MQMPVGSPETLCDLLDNDGDGNVDEGIGVGVPCASNECGPGYAICDPRNPMARVCQPNTPGGNGALEVCNFRDDDCDGNIDEGATLNGAPCNPGAGNPQNPGGQNMNAPAGANGQNGFADNAMVMERCDGQDNDQDGRVDEGVMNTCGQCQAQPMEFCDNMDNDCDALVDEGVKNACGTCGPVPEEVCDGQDNDCDGQIDEGLALNPCGECSGNGASEMCNGQDDDCDGQVDEGAMCLCPRETFMDNTYLFCASEKKSWPAAQMACQQIGYDLAIINDADENTFIFNTLKQRGAKDTWIGLNDRGVEGTFVWVDGTMPAGGYERWDDGEPNDGNGGGNEDCGIMLMEPQRRESKWDDRPCNRDYHYICEL
ncbi:MAG: C-type lectin domain-containing protein [Myxococcota bacterium]|nr:C-type lectin domain-containing protein [Myxococcota bacterium]